MEIEDLILMFFIICVLVVIFVLPVLIGVGGLYFIIKLFIGM